MSFDYHLGEQVSAESWIILNRRTQSYLRGYNTQDRKQIASLTKMYTLYTCLLLNEKLNIDPKLMFVKTFESTSVGTLAKLQLDLYYGLMLPSGNDAAILLAAYYGHIMGSTQRYPDYIWKKNDYLQENLTSRKKYLSIYVGRFIKFMNQQLIIRTLHHKNTYLDTPHGLSSKFQYSTVWQVGEATLHFLKNNFFRKVVNTIEYTGTYLCGTQQIWKNTNALLQNGDGYYGVKTGHTPTAGNCLASYKIFQDNGKLIQLVIVVLGCKTIERRFSETQLLFRKYKEYFDMMK